MNELKGYTIHGEKIQIKNAEELNRNETSATK